MERPSTSSVLSSPNRRYHRQREILPEEEGPVFPEKTSMPTIYLGSVWAEVSGVRGYTRKVWKKDRDSVKTYYRKYGKFYHGSFNDGETGIKNLVCSVDKLIKLGNTSVRIVYSGKVSSNGNKDNKLLFEIGRDLSIRGLVNLLLAKGMTSIELIIVSLYSFIWADVLGLKLKEGKSLTVYYPRYLLPTHLQNSSVEMFTKQGTTSFKSWEFYKAVYKEH